MCLELHLRLSDMLDIGPFPACLLMTHVPGYHVLYHHNEDVVKRRTYREQRFSKKMNR